jgi:hypothetical protein
MHIKKLKKFFNFNSRITSLDLKYNNYKWDTELLSLLKASKLTYVSLEGWDDFKERGSLSVVLENLPETLQHLNLSKCRFHESYLLNLSHIPLTHLNLSETDVESISRLLNFETLEYLDLSGCKNIQSYFPLTLPYFEKLTFLNLIDSSADIQKVIEMKENKNMELKIVF